MACCTDYTLLQHCPASLPMVMAFQDHSRRAFGVFPVQTLGLNESQDELTHCPEMGLTTTVASPWQRQRCFSM